MQEPAEAQGASNSARQKSLQGGGIDKSNPISSLDPAATRSHASTWQDVQAQHDPSVPHLSRTMDQESLNYWWRFTFHFTPEAMRYCPDVCQAVIVDIDPKFT